MKCLKSLIVIHLSKLYSAKLFSGDTFLLNIVKGKNGSANALNNDLSLIWKWDFDWKMLSNPDPNKPAQVLIHPVIKLKNIQVEKVFYQKHVGIFLDEKRIFKLVDNISCKVNKVILAIKKVKVCFSVEIFTHFLQFIFEVPNRLWEFHL